MEVIGTRRANVSDPNILQPLAIEGRPQEFPVKPGHAVVFGYDKVFDGNRTEEALIYCESLEDMQICHDRKHGTTRTSWYIAAVPESPVLEFAPVDFDEIAIQGDFDDVV